MSNTTDPRIDSLILALNDYREGLRQFAMRRLVSIGAPAIPHLIGALSSKHAYTQESAAIALATLGSLAIPDLLNAMKSEDKQIRWGAAWVLASIGPEARKQIPSVPVKIASPAARTDRPTPIPEDMHGVWSDSWLTKVREKLQANRMLDVVNLTTAAQT